jgi:hypothetical protein
MWHGYPYRWKTWTNNGRIGTLQKRIKWIKHYSRGNNSTKDEDIKVLRQELPQ